MAASYRPADDESDEGIVAEINITPLTDVFLVLLIIFMVTSSVVANQSKNIDLPGAEVAETTPEGVTVSIVRPRSMFSMVNRASLDPVVSDADSRIKRVMEAL